MPASERVPAVGVHFFRVPTRAIGRALWRMAVDRRRIAVLDGLEFAKLLGTGDGRTFDLRDADLRTWGLLTVWRDPLQRAAFERSEVIGSWSAIAEVVGGPPAGEERRCVVGPAAVHPRRRRCEG